MLTLNLSSIDRKSYSSRLIWAFLRRPECSTISLVNALEDRFILSMRDPMYAIVRGRLRVAIYKLNSSLPKDIRISYSRTGKGIWQLSCSHERFTSFIFCETCKAIGPELTYMIRNNPFIELSLLRR